MSRTLLGSTIHGPPSPGNHIPHGNSILSQRWLGFHSPSSTRSQRWRGSHSNPSLFQKVPQNVYDHADIHADGRRTTATVSAAKRQATGAEWPISMESAIAHRDEWSLDNRICPRGTLRTFHNLSLEEKSKWGNLFGSMSSWLVDW